MVYVRVQLALLQTSRASPLKLASLQKMRAKGVPAIGRGFMGSLGLRPRPPPPVYTFFCRFCGKGYVNVYSCRRHEKDAHGPRMKCSHCYKFTCPESRISEMRNHLIEVLGLKQDLHQPKELGGYGTSQNLLYGCHHLQCQVSPWDTRRL